MSKDVLTSCEQRKIKLGSISLKRGAKTPFAISFFALKRLLQNDAITSNELRMGSQEPFIWFAMREAPDTH